MTIFTTGVMYGSSRAICNFLDNALREIGKPPGQFIVKWHWYSTNPKTDLGQFRVEFFGKELTQEVGMKAIRLLHSRTRVTSNGHVLESNTVRMARNAY
jgi:hypothetical protein